MVFVTHPIVQILGELTASMRVLSTCVPHFEPSTSFTKGFDVK